MTVEYLTAGMPPPARWRGPALLVAPLLLILGVATAWGADSLRQRAQDQLEVVQASAAQRAEAGEARVLSMLAYASPMIWSTSVPEDVRAGLRALVEGSAAQVVVELRQQADAARTTIVLPWQSEQQALREQVLLQIEAERARFDRIAADARNIADVMSG
jgi:hypothetical protein